MLVHTALVNRLMALAVKRVFLENSIRYVTREDMSSEPGKSNLTICQHVVY
jgi:hypothetical protein